MFEHAPDIALVAVLRDIEAGLVTVRSTTASAPWVCSRGSAPLDAQTWLVLRRDGLVRISDARAGRPGVRAVSLTASGAVAVRS